MGTGQGDPTRLGELRAQIDAIDESVHRLLMQRAGVIDELIRVKGTARNGAAFRPGREADMMRRLVERHSGHLPIGSVEHLWREIIATFTSLQAPFDVTVSTAAGTVNTVEAARYSFGFSVPLLPVPDAAAVVARIEEGGDRLGVVALAEPGPWWRGLRSAQIVSRLPFIEGSPREAATPVLVLAPPLADPVPFEIACFVVEGEIAGSLPQGVEELGREGASRLLAAAIDAAALRRALGSSLDIRPVGGYAAPLRIG